MIMIITTVVISDNDNDNDSDNDNDVSHVCNDMSHNVIMCLICVMSCRIV